MSGAAEDVVHLLVLYGEFEKDGSYWRRGKQNCWDWRVTRGIRKFLQGR